MSQPLTVEHFEKFEKRFDDFVDLYTDHHGDVVRRLDRLEELLAVKENVADLLNRVARLEKLAR